MEQDTRPKHKPLIKPAGKWLIGLIGGASIAVAGLGFYQISQFATPKTPCKDSDCNTSTTPAPPPAVSALGRLEPQGEVIKLSAPNSQEGTRMRELLVKEGARVTKDQVVAILDNRDQRAAVLTQAQQQVKVAQSRLDQVLAGAKTGEIEAQKATIARLQAQLQGEKNTQEATIARLEAQLRGEKDTLEATIARIQAQWKGDKDAQQARLARLEAQLQGEIAAQEATVARVRAQLTNAEAEYQRNQLLYREGVISISLLDTKRLNFDTVQQQFNEQQVNLNKIIAIGKEQLIEEKATLQKLESTGFEQIQEATATRRQAVETLEQQIKEARANLNKTVETLQKQIDEARASLDRISEVRPVDVRTAQAEVESAMAAVEKAQADLNQSYIKSPIDGQVLKIHSRAGEVISNQGIVELGNTQQMFVVAEVYETDIDKVKVGQKAIVTTGAISGEFQGTVAEVGLQIAKKDVLNTDPAADVDARVVEVKIRLDAEGSKRLAGLTNMQVEVKIYL